MRPSDSGNGDRRVGGRTRRKAADGTPVITPGEPSPRAKLASFVTGRPAERRHVAHVEAVDDPGPGELPAKGYVKSPAPGRLGIACSGGGLRSATFNLGALQELRKAGLLRPEEHGGAAYLAAVSGGSYIAVAHTVTAGATEDPSLFDALPPWAPGSPEEAHLRNNSTYLAPGLAGHVWFLSHALWGLFCNVLPFLAVLAVLGHAIGWLYAAGLQPDLAASAPAVRVDGPRVALMLAPFAAGFALLAGRRLLDRRREPPGAAMAWLKAWSPRMLVLGAVGVLVALVFPALIVWVQTLGRTEPGVLGAFGRLLGRLGVDVSGTTGAVVIAELVGLGTTVAGVYRANRGLGRFLLPIAARVAGPLILLVPFLRWTGNAAEAGFQGLGSLLAPDLLTWVGLLVLLAFFGHNVRWSLHPVYKEQLSSAFVLRREREPHLEGDRLVATEMPYEKPVLFSELDLPTEGPARMPELVVCAAVNVSDPVVPPGRGAASFTFTCEHSGGPLTGYVPTSRYERGAGVSVVTLPAMMAISGAALSPSMGRMTKPSVRFLLALFNVRLGVWVPNPLKGDPGPAGRRGLWTSLREGWREPGPLYLLYEALGKNSLDRRFVYISDGGHWENLGLVELLRRGCTEILCLDASGDQVDTFHTIGSAIALARAELRIEIDLDLTPLRPDDTTGMSPSDHAVGRVTYPDGTNGWLVLAKAALPADAPWDLKAYHERDARFPCHPTGDQFFDDEQFEAYRTLGAHAGRGVARTLTELRKHAPDTEASPKAVASTSADPRP